MAEKLPHALLEEQKRWRRDRRKERLQVIAACAVFWAIAIAALIAFFTR